MKNKYVLDTSAVLTFFEDEPGSNIVESLFEKAEQNEITIYLSFMTFCEIYYFLYWSVKND